MIERTRKVAELLALYSVLFQFIKMLYQLSGAVRIHTDICLKTLTHSHLAMGMTALPLMILYFTKNFYLIDKNYPLYMVAFLDA